MAATTVQTSSKKKASKPIERAESPAPSTAASVDKGGDDSFESPYIKELQKSIRNVNKKILNASKNDSLLTQHKGKSLDELVAAKVINADQKAQILKKPALQAQLAQFEEQLTQYQKIHEQYRTKAEAEKAELGQSIEKAKADATKQAKAEFEQSTRDNLLVLSQFLRLAAYRREEATDPESDESQAIEGVLLAIYAGDDTAVASMLKLVNGEDEQVLSIPGQTLETTYSSVKSLAQGYKTSLYAEGGQTDTAPESVAEPEASQPANTETEQPTNDSVAASTTEESAPTPANQAHNGNDLSISQEWVDVKTQDAAETETAAAAPAPEASSNKQSWADDQPEPASQRAAAPADPNDGFQSVQRNRGRHEREGSGNFRGGRGRGGRGGNNRGDGRGRGRGNRNSGVPSRGPRRAEE